MRRSRLARHHRVQKGFSLIETLVALAIASGVLAAFYQSTAGVLALNERGRQQADLMLVSEAVINKIGTEIALVAGIRDGRQAGFDWRVEIQPAEDITVRDDQDNPLTLPARNLFRITISLTRVGARTPDKVIETLRLNPRSLS
jgi:prepilin-type N-terminal cleavage/methylation domain-containing protein